MATETRDDAAVEYEITARVLGARLPEALDCFCTFAVTYPMMVDEEERVGHAEKTTCLISGTDQPRWSDDDEGRFISVSALPHTMVEITLWGRKGAGDETYGSYKLWLKPDNFEESKSMHEAWVTLSGTKYNIPHPDDVAAQKYYEQDPDNRDPPQPIKLLPQLQVDLFCRQVPVAGQCDYCRAVMRDPLADDIERDVDLQTLSLRAPFTLPCTHTVCGEHLVGSGVCPCCQTKVHNLDSYHNYLVDKYLELRLSECSKTCANCDGPRARIFCPDCRYFFCSKCDAAIHDRNPFFRAHVRKDARKPFKIQRANVHMCADHHLPLIVYDSSREPGYQAMCQVCVEVSGKAELFEKNQAGQLLTAALGHDDVVKDYESYRRALVEDIQRRVDALQRITARDIQMQQVEVLTAQTAVDECATQLSHQLAELRATLPRELMNREQDLQVQLTQFFSAQLSLLDKQSSLWANCAVSLLKQNNMVEYVVGPVLEDETDVVIPERANKLDLTQLYQIRVALLAQFHQKFSHTPYAQGLVQLEVSPEASDLFFRFGQVSDHEEDDRLHNESFQIKLNTQEHKFLQLKRSVKAGDLPYFFAIRTSPSASSGGRFPLISQLGATRYGVLSERSLTEPSQLKHAWVFSQRRDVQDKALWRFYHDAAYVDVNFRGVDLTARYLGNPDASEERKLDDPRQPRTDADLVGCLVDRTRGQIEFFKYTPHTDSQNPAHAFFVSQTACVLECSDDVYPTVAVAEGTEDGAVEIVASRFVLSRDEALNVFRECFA